MEHILTRSTFKVTLQFNELTSHSNSFLIPDYSSR